MDIIETYLNTLPAWQKANLVTFRALIHEVKSDVQEDFKWNVPVFLVNGKLQFAMSAFKAHTKYNFIGNGALIEDPHHLFNSGLDSKKARGINLREGENVDRDQLKLLIQSSFDLSSS